ncbi:hypothetical protein HG535_0C01710 [Zygotorulaspora mrakii]|uniref:PRP1 splicing factor N-terminal domain-containing protein n=1 Tax=Zygotorulaspora mrakii TaxID=42260 RepID=A0A7H9B232_ZYGMR|nr:uncharacterized protein HG535_0C01710 [Zygotorulaspora mrakii]QLG71822.1 hypothetical protein HG535_0C01710 [Zygotorulaspora mrakii]
MIRPSFLHQEAPPGYIPGVGRGATGFSTRGNTTKVPKRLQDSNSTRTFETKDTFTQERFSTNVELEEEQEADEIFASVDAKLAKGKNSNKSSSYHNNETTGPNKVLQQFADLKRSLANVTAEEWLNIPEAGDITKRHKRERTQNQLNRKEYAAPDSLIHSTGNVNLSKLTQERERLLVSQLDSSILNRDKVDSMELAETNQLLNELESSSKPSELLNNGQNEDSKKMRDILVLYRKADPTKPEGWIASARLEEKARRLNAAKDIIDQGCQKCPKNEDIWLENLRINGSNSTLCKAMVAEAIAYNPTSLPLWSKAVDLEAETLNKCRVIRKALRELPRSEDLWTLIVKYESDTSEREKILKKAVEFVPQSFNLWKCLIDLQDEISAKKSMNQLRVLQPKEFKVWILAAQVEERFNAQVTIERLVKLLIKGRNELEKYGITISAFEWITQAEELEKMLISPKVVESLIISSIQGEYNDKGDLILFKFIESMSDSRTKIIALRVLLKKSPTNYDIWKHLKATCEKLKQINELYTTFEDVIFSESKDSIALKENPVLALMYSKEIWKGANNTSRALEILDRTLKLVPRTLDIWLAKIKILCFSSSFEEAEKTFLNALHYFESTEPFPGLQRLYHKYVNFLRFQNRNSDGISFIKETCQKKFPDCPIFQIQMGQILHDMADIEKCRETFSTGTKYFPSCAILWMQLALVDEIDMGKPTKARSDLDLAVLKNPQEESLYLAKIRLETKLNNLDQARLIVSQSLQKFPRSPKLWSENIRLLPSKKSPLRKTVFQDALKNTANSCEVLVEIGVSFYYESQFSTALKWFQRATAKNKLYGDAWVWLTRCHKKLSKDIHECHEKVNEYEPVYGDEWISVSKGVKNQYSSPSTILSILS